MRGYVPQLRVNTDLPEPLAKLHEVKSGDTVEKLAVQEYSGAGGRVGPTAMVGVERKDTEWIVARWGERQFRRFQVYLWGCAAGFQSRALDAFHWVLELQPRARATYARP